MDFNKKITTKKGIWLIVAVSLLMFGSVLFTNIDLLLGAGVGDSDTLDGWDWGGESCSTTECNIKAYIDQKSQPCTDNNNGRCYITQVNKSVLDPDLTAANIKAGVTVFGITGNVQTEESQSAPTGWGTLCVKTLGDNTCPVDYPNKTLYYTSCSSISLSDTKTCSLVEHLYDVSNCGGVVWANYGSNCKRGDQFTNDQYYRAELSGSCTVNGGTGQNQTTVCCK